MVLVLAVTASRVFVPTVVFSVELTGARVEVLAVDVDCAEVCVCWELIPMLGAVIVEDEGIAGGAAEFCELAAKKNDAETELLLLLAGFGGL